MNTFDRENKAGAFWRKRSKKGTSYLSGEIDDNRVMAFEKTEKLNPKDPDLDLVRRTDTGLLGCGAMWCRTSKRGTDYLSIQFEGRQFFGFKNGYKDTDRHPDFIVYRNAEQQGESNTALFEDDPGTLPAANTNDDPIQDELSF